MSDAPQRPGVRVTAGRVPQWERLDDAYARLLDARPDPPGGSLLPQTLVTGRARREVLATLAVPAGSRVLDLGTGYAPLALELAHLAPLAVVGIDNDAAVLAAAAAIADELADWLAPGSTLDLVDAAVGALPFAAASFDLGIARLLFQHLPEPEQAARELHRVLRPGGAAFVLDVDDGLSLTYPPPSEDLTRLEAVYESWQTRRGGDRFVGRKLATLLGAAGLDIETVVVLPQAHHQRSEPGDPARQVTASRLVAARSGILDAGLLEAAEFDTRLARLATEGPHAQCRVEGQIAVLARKR